MLVNQYYKKIKWLIFLLVFLPSCEKEYCWECELTTGIRSGPQFPWYFTTTYREYCNKTEKEIAKIIQDTEPVAPMNVSASMVCTKK